MMPPAKHSSKSGHMPSDQKPPCPAPTSTMLYSGLSTEASSNTDEGNDWCERFDCNQRCANYIRKVVEDCLKGIVNFSKTGNVSWKIPKWRGNDGVEKGTG